MSRKRFVGSLVVLLAAAGLSAGCSDGAPPATGPTGPTGPATVAPEVVGAVGAMAAHPAAIVPGAAGPTLRAPLFTVARPGGQGVFVATLISVGGGPVIPVQVDTGSSGLVVDATAAGPATTRFPDQPTQKQYVSHTVTGILGRASVGIGPVSSAPIGVELADVPVGTSPFSGTRGILGVGSANGPETNEVEPAAQLALPAPFDAGQSLAVSRAGLGAWTLGPVTAPPGAQVLPLAPASPEPGAPPVAATSGLRFAKDVVMCWTVGARPVACGPTDLDTGATDTAFNSATDPTLDAGGGMVATGQAVTVSGPRGQGLWSFTTGSTASGDQAVMDALGAATRFNTGVAFYVDRTVAWDYVGGRLVVAPGPAVAP